MRPLIFFYITALAFIIFGNSFAQAELVLDISEPNLEISTGFSGDTLTLFGSSEKKGDIVILVKGPRKNTVIKKKTNTGGLWVSSRSMEFEDVPGYYNVASSRSIFDIAPLEVRKQYRLGINSLTFKPTAPSDDSLRRHFQEALIQNKQLDRLYALTPNAVEYLNDHLFKTRIHMPANVPLGDYEIEAFLFQNGTMIDQTAHTFTIRQVGLAAQIHDFSIEKPFLYGLSVILIAILSSFLAILLLRRE